MNVTAEQLRGRLAARGYRPIRATSDQLLFDRAGDRVIVPDGFAEVPDWIARTIEWHLEPQLGPGWLSEPGTVAGDDGPTGGHLATRRLRLSLVVRPDGPSTGAAEPGGWIAFVLEHPRIAVSGATLEEVRSRAVDATALWFDMPPDGVTLQPVIRLDRARQHLVESALRDADSGNRSDTRQRAAASLAGLGLSPDDCDWLLRTELLVVGDASGAHEQTATR